MDPGEKLRVVCGRIIILSVIWSEKKAFGLKNLNAFLLSGTYESQRLLQMAFIVKEQNTQYFLCRLTNIT